MTYDDFLLTAALALVVALFGAAWASGFSDRP
jgi:hypothetical protein